MRLREAAADSDRRLGDYFVLTGQIRINARFVENGDGGLGLPLQAIVEPCGRPSWPGPVPGAV